MSDGQEKSDDLIAELAKLMASSAGGSEAEAKPAPRLVSDAPRAAAPTIRIPGMDAPVPASPVAAPVVPAPAAAAPAVVRIPGMDQPAAAASAPVRIPGVPVAATPAATPAPVPPAVGVKPAETRRAASFDFGTLPPASSLKPEPLSNWQDREIPRPVPARPAATESVMPPAPTVVAEPSVSEPKASEVKATESRPATPVGESRPAAPVAQAAPQRQEPRVEAPRPAAPSAVEEPIVAVSKPAPAGDSFDFDFGFSAGAPPPPLVDTRPSPRPVAPRISSGDPIADLIAADLDGETDSAPPAPSTPEIVRPAIQAPVVRAAVPSSAPVPQRPVTSMPVRPPQAAPVASPPVHKPADDRFAPVFGVGSRPPAQQQPEFDPMDEIESLIGEAVRVELSAPERPIAPVVPAPAPVVPPLTTGFAPRRAAIKDTEAHVPPAEAAILAAAASGAEVGYIDGGMAGESSPYKRPRAKPERRSLLAGGIRQYVGMAVAGTLLLAAGFGLYWVLGMGRSNDAEAPVLSADATPVKETPPAPAAATDTQGSVVFNQLDGNSTAPTDEQLVSRDDSAETSVADVARTVGEDGDEATGESELANRKVRTVTVRPDGTIVSGDDAVAGSEALPVDRPNVPELPGADVQPSELLAAVPTDDAAPADAIGTAIASTTDPVGADSALTALVEPGPAATIDPNIVAPIPAARPSDRSVLGGGANQQVAAVDPAAPLDLVPAGGNDAPAEAAPVSAAGGAYVQLSSQRTEGDAQASLRSTQNRLSGLLGGQSLEIRRVDLGAKGVWYRVVLPTGSFQQATQACASFKANGADCVAING